MFVQHQVADALLRAALLTPVALLWILFLARVVGLRSFSKMTAFDFVATVATGSLLANAATASAWDGFAQAMAAVTVLFIVQVALAWSRSRSDAFRQVVDNQPRVLMRDGRMNTRALRDTRVAASDVFGKLREANALELREVRAVVLEPTGDISVLHGTRVDDQLMDGLED